MYDLFSLGYWPGRDKLPRPVLVVEDDPSMELHLEAAIHDCEAEARITWAVAAENALIEMQVTPFDLIIADQRLSGPMTGLDLWNYNQSSRQNTPFILISRYPLKLATGHQRKNAPVFLRKPLQTRRLLRLITHFLLV